MNHSLGVTDSSLEKRFHGHDLNNLLFIIGEVSFSLRPLILNGDFIVEFSRLFFSWKSTEIFLFSINHNKNLPRVSILTDPSKLRSSEVFDVVTLESFPVWGNYYLKTSFTFKKFYKLLPLFLYWHWKIFLNIHVEGQVCFSSWTQVIETKLLSGLKLIERVIILTDLRGLVSEDLVKWGHLRKLWRRRMHHDSIF